jgi:phosphoribosylformylglycinamidine synthase
MKKKTNIKKKVRVLVFSGYGLNCEEETAFGFEKAGAKADIVHINDVIAGKVKLSSYQILAFPGGFAYGDDTGSGKAYGNRVKNHLMKDVKAFLESGKLVIGICNGFQILTHVGTQWAHDERGDLFRLLGGLEVLKARVLKQIELPAAADSPE